MAAQGPVPHPIAATPQVDLREAFLPALALPFWLASACIWDPDEIRFFVDGAEHFVVTSADAPLHRTPKAVVLNLAVGGFYDGDPDETTIFPQSLAVDYVRVWQRIDGAE